MSGRFITERFGTARGAARLALSYAEVALGLSGQRRPDPGTVRRLVFVCHGNICRSAYAHVLARRAGMRVASFGLSTATGVGAHPPVIAEAARRGVDMTAHRATDVDDFTAQEGDLLVLMETRHARLIAGHPELGGLPRVLLGQFAGLPLPHLHDPYELDARYLPVCMNRIERAVAGLVRRFPAAAS